MDIDVDTVNMNIAIAGESYIHYNNHNIKYMNEDELSSMCMSCGETQSFNESVNEAYKWTAILYLLGQYGDECIAENSDLADALTLVLQKYRGQPNVYTTREDIKKDIRDVVGEDAKINIE